MFHGHGHGHGATKSANDKSLRERSAGENPNNGSSASAESPTRGQNKGYIVVAVVYLLGLCIGALDMSIVNPARTVIQNTLGIEDNLGVWILTIYTLAYAASIPVMGKLADRHGRKGIYLLCVSLFGIGSIICGLAHYCDNFAVLLLGRVVQAIGGGGIMPVATAEFGTAFPEEKRGMALGVVGMIYGLASILGPSVGSLILQIAGYENWQFVFLVNIPICLAILALGAKRLPNPKIADVKPIDGLGILLLTALTLSLMYGLKNIDFFDFSNSIATLDVWPFLLLFAILLPLFCLREKKAADPIINLSYFKNINIVIALVCAVVSGIIMMGTLFFPQFCENSMMMQSGSGGYFIALLGLGSAVGAMGSGGMIDRHGVKPVLGLGFIGSAIGSLFMAFVACKFPSMLTVCLTMLITGLGLGFTMGSPLNYMMLQNTKDEESNSALATMSLVRSIGTAIAPAIMVAFIMHASVNMQENLMEAMPQQIEVSPLPYADELDQRMDDLRSNPATATMLDGLEIPDLTSMQTIEMDMSGDTAEIAISEELMEEMRNSDVTTIVGTCKKMSTEVFSQLEPQLVSQMDEGIAEGIESMEAAVAQMPPVGPMADVRSEMEETIAMLEDTRDAIPGIFEEAQASYLKSIDENASSIQAAYRDTLNVGFKGMALFVTICSIIGLIILLPYREAHRKNEEKSGDDDSSSESESSSTDASEGK